MRRVLLVLLLSAAAGCTPSALLEIERMPTGTTGARNTGQFPDIQAVPPKAARQLGADQYADIASELNAEADEAASRAPVNGRAADGRARGLVAEAAADERRLRARIRRSQAD